MFHWAFSTGFAIRLRTFPVFTVSRQITSEVFIGINVDSLKPIQNGQLLADEIFICTCISPNENIWMPMDYSIIRSCPIDNKFASVKSNEYQWVVKYDKMILKYATKCPLYGHRLSDNKVLPSSHIHSFRLDVNTHSQHYKGRLTETTLKFIIVTS